MWLTSLKVMRMKKTILYRAKATEKEIRIMEITKSEFINSLKAAVIADERSGVENIEYKKTKDREVIIIRYLGGRERLINAEANSNGMNMLEIAREVYGNGAFGRVITK